MFFITHQTSNGKKMMAFITSTGITFTHSPRHEKSIVLVQYYFIFSNTCLLCSQILSFWGDKPRLKHSIKHFRSFYSNEDELSIMYQSISLAPITHHFLHYRTFWSNCEVWCWKHNFTLVHLTMHYQKAQKVSLIESLVLLKPL